MKGRVTALVAGAAIALTGLGGLSVPAGAGSKGEPASKPSVSPGGEWQGSVGDLTNRLWDAGTHDAKFSGVALDQATKTVVVYRKGGGSSAAYNAARKTMPGQRVDFRSSLLSATETNNAMATVDKMTADFAAQGLEVTSTSTDFRGPVVVHTMQKPGAARKANAMAAMTMVASSKSAPIAGGAVQVVGDGQVQTLTADRWTDQAPFWGGDRIFANVDAHHIALCSGGFLGVSSANHKRYMITASHCVTKDHKFYSPASYNASGYPNSWWAIGTVSTIDTRHDIAFIPTSGAPKIWNGVGSDGNSNTVITGQIHPSAGQKVCQSGATSGRVCGDLTVFTFNHNVKACDDAGAHCILTDVWSAVSPTNSNVARGGDSGGPVYMPSMFGNLAVGINSSTGYIPCAGRPTNNCGSFLMFADIYTEGFVNHKVDMSK